MLVRAHSSSGLGRVPLKDEITGPNPVCATTTKFMNLKRLLIRDVFIFTD